MSEPKPEERPIRLTEAEKQKQRRRSIAIACALGALVALFYFVTIVRMGGNVVKRPI